ncbi:MAG: DUF6371 domain-containing protein [Bacteroidaceae bacterium]|nr:DUF6371 domain-containing protein [Bacteroidaceae bacterium]
MDKDYRYRLDSPLVTGRRQQKTTCPHCGRAKCFVRYVDTRNNCRYVADEVGRCDHEHSCGYHYRPSDYYRDHRWLSESPPRHAGHYSPPPLPPFSPLPSDYVGRSHSPESTFWKWFAGECAGFLKIPPTLVQRIYEDYLVGATPNGNIIFWQIDEQQRVHSGHIMHYDIDGRRHNGYQGWVHDQLKRNGQLPADWTLHQCLYGAHLLPRRPDAHVCLVESEKTALIMAACQPDYLWLATAGSGGLNAAKLECLRGHRFTLFPDSGCYTKWTRTMEQTHGLSYSIDDAMEQYPANTDLADLALKPP